MKQITFQVNYTHFESKVGHTLVVKSGKLLRRLNLICGIIEKDVSI
jgi:hypothetical protein